MRQDSKRRAFTIIELLMVVGIIAILLAILLPVISSARRQANRAACLANLHSIGQALAAYVTTNNGYIPGSPSSSGRYLWNDAGGTFQLTTGISTTFVTGPSIELFDYIGPLSEQMSVTLPSTFNGVDRLLAYRDLPSFQCPSARDMIASKYPYSGASVANGPMLSYCTATAFMLLPPRMPTTLNSPYDGIITMPTGGSQTDPAKFNFWSAPGGYIPKLARVGPTDSKIFLADSGRRSRFNTPPQFIYNVDSPYQDTLFSDFGPFFGATRSYDRSVPNNFNSPTTEPRLYAYRHGTTGAYRMNVLYFDGHADNIDDLTSANPDLWLPTGSIIYKPTQKLNATDYVFWPDVVTKYLPTISPTTPYRVP